MVKDKREFGHINRQKKGDQKKGGRFILRREWSACYPSALFTKALIIKKIEWSQRKGGAEMPRRARVIVPGMPHHIVQRGHNRNVVFVEGRDYEYYLANLAEWKTELQVKGDRSVVF